MKPLTQVANYHLVSLLPFLFKNIEGILSRSLSSCLETSSLTWTNLVSRVAMLQKMSCCLLWYTTNFQPAAKYLILILLDLSAAFDTDNHHTVYFSLFSLGWASLAVYSPGLNLTYLCFHSGCCGKVSFWLLTSSAWIGAGATTLILYILYIRPCWSQSSILMFFHTTLQMTSSSTW